MRPITMRAPPTIPACRTCGLRKEQTSSPGPFLGPVNALRPPTHRRFLSYVRCTRTHARRSGGLTHKLRKHAQEFAIAHSHIVACRFNETLTSSVTDFTSPSVGSQLKHIFTDIVQQVQPLPTFKYTVVTLYRCMCLDHSSNVFLR